MDINLNNLFLKIAFILLILTFLTPAVSADWFLDLGHLIPKEKTIKNLIYKFPLNNNVQTTIVLKDDFKSNNGQIIPKTRLKLISQNGNFGLCENTIINKNEFFNQNGEVYLQLQFTALPQDNPGEYYSQLLLSDTIDLKTIKIKVVIEPWVILKSGTPDPIKIKYKKIDSNRLTSPGLNYLQIASNTKWDLYTALNKSQNDSLLNKQLGITFYSLEKYSSYINLLRKDGFILTTDPQQMIRGAKTTNQENYWIFIPLSLSIEDFTRVKAGYTIFPINFQIKPLINN